jgi:hypothetical protein
VNAFVTGLQVGHDRRDADILKRQFAADVIWGGPFGALVNGYEQLHPIHVRLQAESHGGTPFHYVARHMLRVSDDVVIAHTARVAVGPNVIHFRRRIFAINLSRKWPCMCSSGATVSGGLARDRTRQSGRVAPSAQPPESWSGYIVLIGERTKQSSIQTLQ